MPQHIARPTGPGDFSGWTPHGAATAWQAWANDLQSSFVLTDLAAQRVRVTFENLPADAATVSRVSLVYLAAGDDVGSLRPVLRLSGTDDASADPIVPPTGGYLPSLASFDLAPGSVAWTVARRNALQGGADSVLAPIDPANALNLDSLRLVTDYESATVTVEDEQAARLVRIVGSARVVPVSGGAQVADVVGTPGAAQVRGTTAVRRVVGAARAVPIAGSPRDA